jgi:hypothetical protein
MKRPAILCFSILVLAGTVGCAPTWKSARGRVGLSPAYFYPKGDTEDATSASESRRVSFTVADGWHWYLRGEDFIATRDGVFLQQILVERLHVDQVDQKVRGAFPLAAWSSSAWPIRTAKSLTKRFAAGMPPADAAEALLGSRGNDPSVADLGVRKVVTRTIAGQQAFRASFDFRLKGAVVDPSPLYRSASCGFVLGDWFYGISYTAAARYYFERDAGTFETFLESIRLLDE